MIEYLSLPSCMLKSLSMDDRLSYGSWYECLVSLRDAPLCQPLKSKSSWVSAEKEKATRNLSVHFTKETSRRGSTHSINETN